MLGREADVRCVGLRKRYGDVDAVDGVDLEIGRGEFFTLLGPSGSGKTTTLRLIAGFERPDQGRVELRDRVHLAAGLTLADVVLRLPVALATTGRERGSSFFLRAGGLRGGRFSAAPRHVTLDRVAYVPGVTVSGRVTGEVEPYHATVEGARGTLTVRGHGVTLRLVLRDGRLTGGGGRFLRLDLS